MEASPGATSHTSGLFRFLRNSVLLKIFFALMAADAQPIVHCRDRHLNIFGSFPFNHRQAASPRNSQKVEYAAVACCEGRNL
jgi:hypothetical protein